MESSSHKRAREEAVLAAGEGASPEIDAKRLRPEDLLDMLDDDTDAAAADDLASVMRSLEEEIASFDEEAPAAELVAPPQPELGFLLEASDDELGLPPAGASSSEEAGAGGAGVAFGLDGQIWGFEDETAGGFGGYGASSPEAAAAIAAAAAAGWDDEGFDAGLFAFGDEPSGPSDLATLRHETMPAV
ncbi:uncharacterized protein LOC133900229 [Phragmites australis]|uniref:uncharacterized protein LOC133900229 n=1 Tax=Phragmites australis TaxID=29695 RepID=UPI002D78281A|nr:uncharacterized protein LOC133900229 [Phragmites australis]